MAIDVKERGSVGWWMNYCWQQLKADQPRFDSLDAWRLGNPPLPRYLPKSLKAATKEMIQMAQLTVGDLVVQAMAERMNVRSIRTAAAGDDNGDRVAMQRWRDANLPMIQTEVYRSMFGMSRGYVMCSLGADGKPVGTYEDPRQMTHVADPLNPVLARRVFKLYYDPVAGRDYAVLREPGKKTVASRLVVTKSMRRGPDGKRRPVVTFEPSQFTIHPVKGSPAAEDFDDPDMLSEDFTEQDTFVVPFENRDSVGEFELHIENMKQINHVILQSIIIATFQAFRQRALELADDGKGDLPEEDDDGKKIDYDDLLAGDPGAIWLLPIGAKLWESGQVDMTGVLQLIKDSLNRFASTSRTPFSMFSSDAINQSAEGAQNSKEGLIFKVDDRKVICDPRWARVSANLAKLAGDEERSDPSQVIIGWSPTERYSLAEMAQADSQANSLPDEEKWERIWQMTPDEVAIAQSRRAAQALREAAAKAVAPAVAQRPESTPAAA